MILSKDSFTEIETWLATKLTENNKNFYFVRTFMDNTLEEEEFDKDIKIKERDENGKLTKEMKKFMEETRDYYKQSLEFSNNDKVPLYLISSHYPERFEFLKLLSDLTNNFPAYGVETP